ncbi:MAG: tetratricopeptide repeat protein [Nitrospirae bacterium]|nr:tetratricopeptide repeat protein [Nitrospirota bacterium]
MKYKEDTNKSKPDKNENAVFYNNPTLHLFIIMLVGLLVYSNTFKVPFVLDDESNIVDNPLITDFRYFTDKSMFDTAEAVEGVKNLFNTRIIGFISFAINYKLNGLDVTGYHIFNLLVHIVNAMLVYWLIILTFAAPFFSNDSDLDVYSVTRTPNSCALLGALLFVVHPIQTQAVTYIVQRFASLATLFYLLSVSMYVRARLAESFRTRSTLYAISFVSTICAMTTKEISFTIPLTIVLYEFMFFKGSVKKRITYVIPLLLTMPVIPLTMLWSKGAISNIEGISKTISGVSSQNITRWDYLITQFRVIVTYIRLLFLPVNQNLDYDYTIYRTPFSIEILGSLLIIISILGMAVYMFTISDRSGDRRFFRLISFGILWFFITLSVESSIIPIADVIFEHRLYLPLVGFCLVFMSTYILIKGRIRKSWEQKVYHGVKGTEITVLIAILIALAIMAYMRNEVWRDKMSLWADVIKKSPKKARPHYNLGVVYGEAGYVEDALKQYQTAINLNPNNVESHNNLGLIYASRDNLNEALKEYQISIKLNPNYAVAHNNIGIVYFKLRQFNEASIEFQQAIKLKPRYADAHSNLGGVYVMFGRYEEAIKEFQTALTLDPNSIAAKANLDSLKKKMTGH